EPAASGGAPDPGGTDSGAAATDSGADAGTATPTSDNGTTSTSGDGPWSSATWPDGDEDVDDATTDPPPDFQSLSYADCVSGVGPAACGDEEFCFVDIPAAPTAGICLASGCEHASQCSPPAGTNGVPACQDVTGDGVRECVVACDGETACPSDMQCFMRQHCLWPVHGFTDCLEDPSSCLDSEACLVFDSPAWSVCSGLACGGDAAACPPKPPGGTAVVACEVDWDSDGVPDCTLDCSAGQTCPGGMICQGELLCASPAAASLACADFDLASLLGVGVASGSTLGAGDDTDSDCGGGGVEDVVFSWLAPLSGILTISTVGSNFDTVLAVQEQCDGGLLACNDDTNGLTSSVVLIVQAGDRLLITVDGFSDAGDYVLSIDY
ncbi:MAG: hypothetical protein JKY37_28365, partial [Nannocystaceae bacterium]|nr:hypothetical protein [Nannocystaceae bacterium]